MAGNGALGRCTPSSYRPFAGEWGQPLRCRSLCSECEEDMEIPPEWTHHGVDHGLSIRCPCPRVQWGLGPGCLQDILEGLPGPPALKVQDFDGWFLVHHFFPTKIRKEIIIQH